MGEAPLKVGKSMEVVHSVFAFSSLQDTKGCHQGAAHLRALLYERTPKRCDLGCASEF